TAFNRHYPDESNARNLMQRRQEILNDITDTTAAVFMGLTVACARCHDHKYDPIRQSDYYRLQAFYANSGADDDIPLVSETELKQYRTQLAAWEEKTRVIREGRRRWQELKEELKKYADRKPADLPIGTGITDVAPSSPDTHVLRRGVYDEPKEEVEPGFLQILDPRPARIVSPNGVRSSGRRM